MWVFSFSCFKCELGNAQVYQLEMIMNKLLKGALAGAVVFAAAQAQASTISVSVFSVADYTAAVGGFTTIATEDFEGFTLAANGAFQSASGTINSSTVGSFASLGGTGSGGTVTGAGTDGTKIAVREGNVFGRQSTTDNITGNKALDQFLDSNDTLGISWMVDLGGSLFNRIAFVMTDATDTGAKLTISAGGVSEEFSGLGRSNQQIVLVSFASLQSLASITLQHNRINDGLSVDDIAVGAVPLPAGGMLLLTGLGAVAAMRRRKKAA